MTDWLSRGVKFDAIISNNDEMAIGALQAMKLAGVDTKKAIVGGVDATQDALASMKAGDLKVTVFQDAAAQGKGAVDVALELAAGMPVDTKVYIPFHLVTPTNMDFYTRGIMSEATSSCLNEAVALADKICGEISNKGSSQLISKSGTLNTEAEGLIAEILGTTKGGAKLDEAVSSYNGVLRDQLAGNHADVRDCKASMVEITVKKVCPPK
jgi:hypothetical protein